jgi:hypothetical protein
MGVAPWPLNAHGLERGGLEFDQVVALHSPAPERRSTVNYRVAAQNCKVKEPVTAWNPVLLSLILHCNFAVTLEKQCSRSRTLSRTQHSRVCR